MSDVKAVRYLLANNAGLIAVVPATRIIAGILPQGTTAPAIAVTHVTTIRRQLIASQAECVARVQVTVMAATYPLLKSTLALVRAALPRTHGSVNGVNVLGLIVDTTGPDFTDESGLFLGSQDVILTYTE